MANTQYTAGYAAGQAAGATAGAAAGTSAGYAAGYDLGFEDGQDQWTNQYSTVTTTQITVLTSSTPVLPSTPARIGAVLVNDSDVDIYITYGTPAVLNSGIRLVANGGTFAIGTANLYTGVITAIRGVADGTKYLTVTYY